MHLDGNAAAGPLADIFTREVTTAVATCASCGNSGPLGGRVSGGSSFMTSPSGPEVSISRPRANASAQTRPARSPFWNSMPRARPRPLASSSASG